MIREKNILKGFTLSETLINILIVSTLSLSMMFILLKINDNFNIEENRTEVIYYANRVLNELSNELAKAETGNYDQDNLISLTYPQGIEENNVNYRWNKNEGFIKITQGVERPIDDSYIPLDKHNRLKYKIHNFYLADSLKVDTGDNVVSEAEREGRSAGYTITLSINLFDKKNHLIETLDFRRKVFSPSRFFYDKNSENEDESI